MSGRWHAVGVGLALAASIAAPALAQSSSSPVKPYPTCTKKVEPYESEAAHTKYLAGRVDYDDGKYEAAIQQFREAYAKDCTKHELLIIISRAYEFKTDYAEAVRALETYSERVPAEAAKHRSRIDKLKELLAEQRQKAAAAPPPSTNPEPPAPEPAVVTPPADEPRGHTVFPWLVAGAGVVAVAVGIVLVATVPDMPFNCNPDTGQCGDCPTANDPYQPCARGQTPVRSEADFEGDKATAGRARDQPTVGAITIGAGAAFVVGGLVWHFLEPTGEERASALPRIAPTVSRGYGGLVWTGRF